VIGIIAAVVFVVFLLTMAFKGSTVASKNKPGAQGIVSQYSTTAVVGCNDLTVSDYYTLTSDDTCFNIGTSDVTLDCNGFKLTGPSEGGAAVTVTSGVERVTVKNCNIDSTGALR